MNNRIRTFAAILILPAAAAFCADEVKLVDASSRVTQYRGPEIQTLTADILVKNLGPAKKVGIRYRTQSGSWADALGTYQYTMGDGRERWQVSFSPCYSVYDPACAHIDPDFAAFMEAGGQAYWDNNGGANFHLNRQSGYRLANGFKVFTLYPGMVNRSPGGAGAALYVTGRVLVENLGAAKSVKLVYTVDGWAHRAEVPLAFVSGDQLYPPERFVNPGEFGGEAWDFSFSPPDAQQLEYFIQYSVNGQTFYDSNFGKNYRLAIPEHPGMQVRGTFNGWQSHYMWPTAGIDGSYRYQAVVQVSGHDAKERFKFDMAGNWAVNYGENDNGGASRSGTAERNGGDIRFLDGPGNYLITFANRSHAFTVAKQAESGPVKRTLVFIQGQTQPGQDLFLRGGIDHGYSGGVLHKPCADSADYANPCAIPFRHRLRWDRPDQSGDQYLDWYGPEAYQTPTAAGSPLIWTTNDPGHAKSVAKDTVGYTPLNAFGPHYWMLDVDMDCSRTVDGWFEVKSFIRGGAGWENDVAQPGRPWPSHNHFGRCGMVNVFRRGESEAQILPF